jgi:hypothetical protein
MLKQLLQERHAEVGHSDVLTYDQSFCKSRLPSALINQLVSIHSVLVESALTALGCLGGCRWGS